MRSSSEVRWVRVRNTINQRTKVSSWHAVVPGYAANAPAPGVACEVGLSGAIQWESNEGVKTRDGKQCGTCLRLAERWIASLSTSPGEMNPEPENDRLAAPGEGG